MGAIVINSLTIDNSSFVAREVFGVKHCKHEQPAATSLKIRPISMGWQMPTLDNRMTVFCHPWKFLCGLLLLFYLVAKKLSPQVSLISIIVLPLGLYETVHSFLVRTFIHLIVTTVIT